MKALRFDRLGHLDALTLAEVPAPAAAHGEVRVRIRAAGINPSDVKNVLGRFPYTTLPRTPGRDFAGEVVEGPPGLLGADVWGTGKELGFTRDGAHADYVVLPAAGVARKPSRLSFEQAAACGVPYTTAWDAIERARVGIGTKVLILGIGAVGSAALGLARARGAEVVVAVRRADQADALRRAGLTALPLESGEALADAAKKALPGGADVVIETTGAWLPQAVTLLAPFGRIAVIAAPADGHVRVPVLDLYRSGGSIVGVNSLLYDAAACARILERIGEAFDRGELEPPAPIRAVPLTDGVAAYRAIDGGVSEKIVLVGAE